jgi:Holliday junction resolvase RusA-like endonuclease
MGVPPYLLNIVFGFSSPLADIDNGLKPFIDILQKRYEFNDKDIVELNVKKEKAVKGGEFILFEILTIK